MMLKSHMLKALSEGIRFDGRKPLDYRDVLVEYGISKNAEGSARVKIGGTEVFAGIKLSIGEPYSDTPDEGALMVEANLTPMSSPEFETGPPDIQAVELARVVDRGIREAHAIDMKKLCIKEGEKCWLVSIDVVTINDEGNLLDAAGLAALAALKDAVFPKIDKEYRIDYKDKTKEHLPLKKEPIPVTIYKIGGSFIVDPSTEEEKTFDAKLTVTSTDNLFCAMQKGGDVGLTMDDISKMLDIGIEKGHELRKHLKEGTAKESSKPEKKKK